MAYKLNFLIKPPGIAYITKQASEPVYNELILWVYKTAWTDLPQKAERFARGGSICRSEGTPTIYIFPLLGEDAEHLCSVDDFNHTIIEVKSSKNWSAGWEDECWVLRYYGETMPDELSQEFIITKLKTQALEGITSLYIFAENFDGIEQEKYTAYISKYYPPRILEFKTRETIVPEGAKTVLNWNTENAANIMIIGTDKPVKGSSGSLEVTVERPTTYILLAENKMGASDTKGVFVNTYATQWKLVGDLISKSLPYVDSASRFNNSIMEFLGEMWVCHKGKLLKSSDGRHWHQVSLTSSGGTENIENYTVAALGENIYMLGGSNKNSSPNEWEGTAYRFEPDKKTWVKESFGQGAARKSIAAAEGDDGFYCVNCIGSDAQIYQKVNKNDDWSFTYFFEKNPASLVSISAYGEKMILAIYTGVKIIFYESYSGDDWIYMDSLTVRNIQWLQLVTCMDKIHLICSGSLYVRDGSWKKASVFHPELFQSSTCRPWVGVFDDAIWMAGYKDESCEYGEVWKYIP